jgi:GGDEF domain-containing protein
VGLKDANIPHPDQKRVTASIGVAAFDAGRHTSCADVINSADAAMRHAENAGRNQIQIDHHAAAATDPVSNG